MGNRSVSNREDATTAFDCPVKDYPVTGEANADMRSVKKTGNSYAIVNKKGGKPTITGTVTFSKDGKTRTLVTKGKDDKGKPWTATYVFDRQ